MSLVTGATKISGRGTEIASTAGRFHGNPVSGNQPWKWPPTSPVTLMELQWRNFPYPIPILNHFLCRVGGAGHWIGNIGDHSSASQSSTKQANFRCGDQSSDLSKVVIHKE